MGVVTVAASAELHLLTEIGYSISSLSFAAAIPLLSLEGRSFCCVISSYILIRFGCQLQNFLQEAALRDGLDLALLMSFSDHSLRCREVLLAHVVADAFNVDMCQY